MSTFTFIRLAITLFVTALAASLLLDVQKNYNSDLHDHRRLQYITAAGVVSPCCDSDPYLDCNGYSFGSCPVGSFGYQTFLEEQKEQQQQQQHVNRHVLNKLEQRPRRPVTGQQQDQEQQSPEQVVQRVTTPRPVQKQDFHLAAACCGVDPYQNPGCRSYNMSTCSVGTVGYNKWFKEQQQGGVHPQQ